MKTRICGLLSMLTWLVACSQAEAIFTQPPVIATQPRDPTASLTPSNTMTIPLVTTNTPIPTVESTTTVEYIHATTTRLCPPTSKTSLSELGIKNTSHLIVAPINPKANQISYSLLGSDGSANPIQIHNASNFTLYNIFAVSPDQKWFAALADTVDGKFNQLWFSSADGSKQWPVSLDEGFAVFDWITADTIILSKQPQGDPALHETSLRLNPFEGSTTPLTAVGLEYSTYAFSPDASQVIYFRSYRGWQHHDFTNDTNQVVFPWADEYQIRLPDDASVIWNSKGVSIAFMDESKLDIVRNLSSEMLMSTAAVREQLEFKDRAAAWAVSWLSPSDSDFIAFRRSNESGEFSFYILDVSSLNLYEYCLPQSLLPLISYVSIDERFMAWQGRQDGVEGVMIMEIASGERVWIPQMRVVGWVELSK